MINKKVSIIIPIYNVEKYLDKCIESIVGQTYKNLEIILVDDGSPDSCPSICDDWAKKDNRIKVIHKTNGGVSSARNTGIDAATGDYVVFIDGDDCINAKFSQFIENADENSDIVITPWTTLDVANEVLELIDANFESLISRYDLTIASSCAKLFKVATISGVKFSEGVTVGEDKEFVIKALLKSDNVEIINLPFYEYTQNPESVMSNKGYRLICKLFDSTQKVFDNIETYECSSERKLVIKREFSSNLYGVFRFYPNCNKSEQKLVRKLIKENKHLLKIVTVKSKKIMYYIMQVFGVRFGLAMLHWLRKFKIVE